MKGLTYITTRINAYKKVYDNWISILKNINKGEKIIDVVLKDKSRGKCTIDCVIALVDLVNKFNFNPSKFHFESESLYYNDYKVIQDSYLSIIISAGGFIKEGEIWYNKKYNIRFINKINFNLFENFVLEQYNTEIEGEVVDIGANIGDSAIYFVLKGATHVYAFEPLFTVYKIALQNVKINNLEDKITLINAAISSKEGKTKVPSTVDIEESGGFTVTNEGDIEVPMLSFNNVRKMVKDPYLLKLDCEGCEADIIFSSELDFEKIFVESHEKITKIPHGELIKRLEEQYYRCEERIKIDSNTKLFYCTKLK
ncbi:FkbM family methyltransferase [Stygiolobus caldivivus]|uniref:Methyltransferase FkbM domain-containing protein n=1 Tax=Stygiolobus caldivivus TaxID=2824673 RepID=A0A8D5ZHK0_9CREN|nr:FkbM family methyltransferase [Stygiolobus caldivivus]BCU68776.1 hypothetical protein KN1_00730 [Stygiolobus caldivivus]